MRSAFGLGSIKALENEKNEVEQLRRRALSLGILKQSKLSTDSKNDGLVGPLKAFETTFLVGADSFLKLVWITFILSKEVAFQRLVEMAAKSEFLKVSTRHGQTWQVL